MSFNQSSTNTTSSAAKANSPILLQLNNVGLAFDGIPVLSDVTLSLKKGQIGCILGPSGSGKTSMLRAIAGFLPIIDGSIDINGKEVSSKQVNQAPRERSIGIVFQDFALFPHMTVQQNVAFGLQSVSKEERNARVAKYLQITGIQTLADQYPAQLSGGQQQRVAIARAIAPQPDLLLMDEAFSSLDPILREQVAHDVRSMINQLGLTALLVTHDQTEAFAFADVIAVVAENRLQQFSSAYDLYHEPETFFVAKFIGEGAFITGTICLNQDKLEVATAFGHLPLTTDNAQTLDTNNSIEKALPGYVEGQKIKLLIRPDDVIHDDASPIKAKVLGRNFRGAFIRYDLQLPNSNESVLCFAPSHHDHAIGESFGVRAEVEHLIHFAV
jgi:iron(III) transport system ATP-binding protein